MMDALDFVELATTPAAIALTLVVAVVYPVASYLRYRAMSHWGEPWPRARKLRLYASTVLIQWTLVFATVLVLRTAGGGLADIGERVGSAATTTMAITLLVGAFAFISSLTLRTLARAKAGDLPPHVRRAGKFLPVDGAEGAGFVVLALTAGICEEILYRGWLVKHLEALTGNSVLAIVLAAIVFGLGHAYQGRIGVIGSGALGAMLGGVVWWTGSLVPGQVLHVLIDLTNGFAIGRTVRRLRASAGSFDPSASPTVESGP
jgi:membrane protease YdiL (CAAX protease family)